MYCIVLYFPRYLIGKGLVGEIRGGHPELHSRLLIRELSGSVVECLTRDWGAAGLSLTCITALCLLSKTHLCLGWLSTGSTQEDSSLHNWTSVDGTERTISNVCYFKHKKMENRNACMSPIVFVRHWRKEKTHKLPQLSLFIGINWPRHASCLEIICPSNIKWYQKHT